MTGFFHHLAGLAVGAKAAGVAQLSLPPRFAPSASPLAEGNDEPVQKAGQPAGSLQFRPGDGQPVVREAGTVRTTMSNAGPSDRSNAATPLRDPANGETHSLPLASAHGANEPSMDVRRQVEVVTGREVPALSRPMMVMPSMVPGEAVEEPAFRKPIPSPPLSTAAVAARAASVERVERPVVHVTIDRIDVRPAASPKPRVEQRRPRPQATVSLADYLGGRSGRE